MYSLKYPNCRKQLRIQRQPGFFFTTCQNTINKLHSGTVTLRGQNTARKPGSSIQNRLRYLSDKYIGEQDLDITSEDTCTTPAPKNEPGRRIS
ncbi:unnamed protein product [Periconia digitata]|uniref:Uncharacterized protein n=1 Tax=Periconia digitata TaxID=1303443 RepID=A0A9W4XJQ3_9PLEO|nr:unnamed protein product [Periconia digitata]